MNECILEENIKNKYKISIIVPVYQSEKYLKKCVGTLTGQDYDNLEILLIDDGSTDKSGEICEGFALEDHRIRVIHKENGGLVSAWKRGVAESAGEYLCFVDSDDWIDLNMIGEMAARLSGSPKEIIAADYVIEREGGSRQYVWQRLPSGEYGREAMEKEVIPNLLGNEYRYVCLSRCMKLISRKLVEENCKYSNPAVRMGEDVTVMLPALIDCDRLVILEHKAFYHYLLLAGSMAHKYDEGLYGNIRLLGHITEQILRDKFTGEQLSYMLKRAKKEYILMMLLVIKNEARGNKAGYRKNILDICRQEEIRKLCRNTDVTVESMANKLPYFVMRHPNIFTVRALRLAMVFYYRKYLSR